MLEGVLEAATKLKDTFSSEEKLRQTRQHVKKQRHHFADKGLYTKVMAFPVVMYGCDSWIVKRLSNKELMLLNCGVGEDSWESLEQQEDQTSQSYKKSTLNIHWKN